MPIDEPVTDVLHWSTLHEEIGQRVHSHLHVPSGTLFDPRVPEEGFAALDGHGAPKQIVLSNRLHSRDARAFLDHFGPLPVLVHEAGLHRFADDELEVRGFGFGDELAPGMVALPVEVLTPEETAVLLPSAPGALLFADAVMRDDDGAPYLVPEGLRGDDADAIGAGLRHALGALLDQDFDALLMAHGPPLPTGGHTALAALAGSAG